MMLQYIVPLPITVLTLLLLFTSIVAQTPGKTTRYWDCCKPSCAWPRDGITAPVRACTGSGVPLEDVNAKSGCGGGAAYTCSDQTPWVVSDTLAYGFASVSAAGGDAKCCSCYELSFTSGPVSGKTMVVQATNTGGDVDSTQFDIAIPAGGVGIYDGCTTQWAANGAVWGKQYGGATTNTCSSMPKQLQAGCDFRWGWMGGADNPTVNWKPVACPAALVAKSGCARIDDTPTGATPGDSSSSAVPYSSASTIPSPSIPAPASLSSSSYAVNPAVSSTLVVPDTTSSNSGVAQTTSPSSVADSSSSSVYNSPASSTSASLSTPDSPAYTPPTVYNSTSSSSIAAVKAGTGRKIGVNHVLHNGGWNVTSSTTSSIGYVGGDSTSSVAVTSTSAAAGQKQAGMRVCTG